MKKKILRICFKPLTLFNKLIRKDERLIFFYSNLGFRDNVRAFYEYLIDNKYNEKYKIVVSINDWENYKDNAPQNVAFINNSQGIRVFMKAKYAFYCFGKYPIKPAKNQKVVNLWHGMPLKKIGNMENGLEKVDYNYFSKIVATSEMFVPILMKCFSCTRDQVIITGQPRNDEMFRVDDMLDVKIKTGTLWNGVGLDEKIVEKDAVAYKEKSNTGKTILWLPTYRDDIKKYPAPLLDENNMSRLNELLRNNNSRLIIKTHPLQQLSGTMDDYSNIDILCQDDLNKRNISVYSLLRAADGLISDYSSVYFDYMMLDRPLAFSINDMEEYSKDRGFVFEEPLSYMPGHILREYVNVEEFIKEVIEGRDSFREKRHEINKKVNLYNDGNSGKRIAEAIFEEA